MNIVVRDNSGTKELSLAGVLSGERIIYLNGQIDYGMAVEFAQKITWFSNDDPTKPVKVFITSDGGMVEAGMMIYDIIRGSSLPIKLYCLGKAYSMAAVIFASGRNGRYILEHSRVMIHEPLIAGGLGGKTSSIQQTAENMMATKKMLDGLIAGHTGQPLETVEGLTKEDKFFTAQEAVEFGMADAVLSFAEMIGA